MMHTFSGERVPLHFYSLRFYSSSLRFYSLHVAMTPSTCADQRPCLPYQIKTGTAVVLCVVLLLSTWLCRHHAGQALCMRCQLTPVNIHVHCSETDCCHCHQCRQQQLWAKAPPYNANTAMSATCCSLPCMLCL